MIGPVPSLWGFLAVTVPLVVTPGASTAIVLRNSLAGGVRAGLVTTLGVNAGSLFYGLLSAFGFALALQRWPTVWLVLRAVGVGYLAWLAIQSLRRAWRPATDTVLANAAVVGGAAPKGSVMKSLREGFLTNAMNPSLATFYFVILPQFIPRGAPVPRTALFLTAVHITLAASCHTAWAIAGASLSRALASGRARQVLDAAAGIALLGFALTIAF
jgi:threonine/homoserine/homoserine lactone efflux protein